MNNKVWIEVGDNYYYIDEFDGLVIGEIEPKFSSPSVIDLENVLWNVCIVKPMGEEDEWFTYHGLANAKKAVELYMFRRT